MALRDLQINAIVEYVETDKDGRHNDNIHVDAPVVEVTEIYDEPPKEIPNIVKKGDNSSAKGLTKKKTQPNESDPNSFDVENEKDR